MYEPLGKAAARSLGDGQVKSMTLCRGESETQCAGEQRVCQHARVQARITAHDHERSYKCARAQSVRQRMCDTQGTHAALQTGTGLWA